MGIVHGDRTLKEVVEERECNQAEAGSSYGPEALHLFAHEPTQLERIYWKLITATQYGRDTSMLISTSPSAITGELLQFVATPDGRAVASSWGLCGHSGALRMMIGTMGQLDYDEDPGMGGIHDGDIFSCNDPVHGSSQNNDMYTVLPLFAEDKLIGWAAASLHLVDVGSAFTPGMAGVSPTTYTDGFVVPPQKTGQNFVQSKAWELTLKRRTRMGVMNILDDKMKLVGALMVRERVLNMTEEFGTERFVQAMHEIIERDRREIIERVKAWQIPMISHHPKIIHVTQKQYLGTAFPEAIDCTLHVPATCQINPDGTITQDFRGASSQGFTHYNCYPGGWNLGAYTDFPVLAMGPAISNAIYEIAQRKTDPGSLCQPTRDDLGSVHGCVMAIDAHSNLGRGYALGRFARGFLEEAWVNEVLWGISSFEGSFANGTPFASADWSLTANMPLGVTPWRDGVSVAVGTGNPLSDIGEAEEYEFLCPAITHLSRGLVPDVMVHGKYRGPVAFGIGYLVTNPGGKMTFHSTGSPTGTSPACIVGICGGYPALPSYILLLHKTNVQELIAQQIPLPRNALEARDYLACGLLTAEQMLDNVTQTPEWEVTDGDLIYYANEAGSSWGEPLDRDPARVCADLEEGWLSPEVAQTVYGVVAQRASHEWTIDVEATRQARQRLKERRKHRAVPVRDWWRNERKRVQRNSLPEMSQQMYEDCRQYETFRDAFGSFWQVAEDEDTYGS